MTNENITPKAIIIYILKYSYLKYLIEHDIDINDDKNLIPSLYGGWKKGIEGLGYEVIFVHRPSYLIPIWTRRISPKIYVGLLKYVKRMPGIRWIDNILYNLYLYFTVRSHRPKFLYLANEGISKWMLNTCKKYSCDTIEYHGTIAALKSPSHYDNVTKNVDYVVSGLNLPRLLDFDISDRFYRIDIGANAEDYGEVSFDRGIRPIDICAIGRYDDSVFYTRSRILNDFLETDFVRQLTLAIAGFASFTEDSKYKHLKQKVEGPIYGQDYINSLKSSKMAIVIPSDDHIRAGNGMPMRIFQNAAAGCMQLVYNCDAVGGLFKANEEIVLFDDVEDLLEKVKYFLEHDDERVQIARNAREHFLKEYTAQEQIQKLIRRIYDGSC